MKKNQITENELKQIVNQSIKKVLKEASYEQNDNFNDSSNNTDLQNKFISVIEKLVQNMEYAINELSYIQTTTTDEKISIRARVIISDLLNRGMLAKKIYNSAKTGKWDFN